MLAVKQSNQSSFREGCQRPNDWKKEKQAVMKLVCVCTFVCKMERGWKKYVCVCVCGMEGGSKCRREGGKGIEVRSLGGGDLQLALGLASE